MPNSMHCHRASRRQPPSPIHDNAPVRPLNVVVAGVSAKGVVGHISSALKQLIARFLVHGHMVQRGVGFFNSHFFSVSVLSHVANVSAAEV